MDTVGNRAAKKEIAMIKVRRRIWPCKSSTGRSRCTAAASATTFAGGRVRAARTLRFADGPDEVHREQIGKLELSRYRC